jgi:hypothetical protein
MMTPNQQSIIKLLNDLPLKEIIDAEFNGKIQATLQTQRVKWYSSDERKEECRLREEQNAKKRQTKAERELVTRAWALENLKPGMYVKMSGTRDKTGMRKVVAVEREQVVCRKIEPCWLNEVTSYASDEVLQIGTKWFHVMHDVTTHGAEKVTHTYERKDQKYVLTPVPG